MASLDENYAGGGFGHALQPGRRPALIVIDFVMAYLKPGSPLYAGVETTRDECAVLLGAARDAGIPVTPFWPVHTRADLEAALASSGYPAVLKTSGGGYDGKGQVKIERPADAIPAWRALGGQPCVLEQFVDFALEVSVVAARGVDGAVADFGVVENRHARHVLDVTIAPAGVSERVRRDAVDGA